MACTADTGRLPRLRGGKIGINPHCKLAARFEPTISRAMHQLSIESKSAMAVVMRSIIVIVVSSGCMFGSSGE